MIETGSMESETRCDKHEGRGMHGHWQPGYCPNPNGRRGKSGEAGASLTAALHRALESEPKLIDRLASKMLEHFEAGNAVAIKQVWDRLDGTVTERSETLVKQAEANEMSREAILIAADTIRRQEAENLASTIAVEPPLGENRSFDTPTE